jgi:hypothetical protein
MPSSMRSLIKIFIIGMLGGIGALMLLPSEGKLVASAPVPDPPAQGCKQQAWTNADRGCLAWTAARDVATPQAVRRQTGENDVPSTPAPTPPATAENAVAAASLVSDQDTTGAAPPTKSTARPASPEKHARKSRGTDRRTREALGMVRSFGDSLSDVPISGYAVDRAGRRVLIRPTSPQDVYYYERGGVWPRQAGWR